MQARTKKPPIDIIVHGYLSREILLRGPAENAEKAISRLLESGFEEVPDSVPWRKAFSEYSDGELPGMALLGARTKEGLTQKQLAEKIGIAQAHISAMENGKRPIGKKMAQKFADVLNVDYRVFL